MSVNQRTGLGWDIISAALTLPERLDLHRKMPSAFTADPMRSKEIEERWSQLMGRKQEEGVEDRIRHLGHSRDDMAAAVGVIDPVAEEAHGRSVWMEVCEEALAWDGDLDEHGVPTAAYLTGPGEEPLPFEHALVPWVDVATMRLRRRRPDLDDELPAEVLREEQRGLLGGLATFARDCNVNDFSKARLGAYDANDMAMGMFMSEPPRDVYRSIVRGMVGPEMRDWMKRYPALARLLGVRVEAWARAVGELLERMESDRELIAGRFNEGRPIGVLSKARFGRGDSHNGGRSVAILEFDSGLKLVYKPRSLSIDEASQALLARLNSVLEPEHRIRVPEAMDRGLYGWVEFVEPRPCSEEEDLRLFHLRMGVLLGIVHLLQGNDFHLENVIASGSMPVPIDLETISVPSAILESESPEEDVVDPARELVSNSVLGTLLLPAAMAIGRQRDLRQLGALRVEVPSKERLKKIRKLSLVNTDFQRWIKVDDDSSDRPNSEPWIEGGDRVDASLYLEDTKRGYRLFYEAVQSHARDFAEGFPELDDAWVRVLNRATNVYMRLMLESCDAGLMGSGLDRWIHLQRLALSVSNEVTEQGRDVLSHLVEAETNSLFDGDIAYFSSRGGGLQYAITDPTTGEYSLLDGATLGMSARDRAEEQLGRMSPEDLGYQIRFQGDAYRSALTSLSRMLHGSPGDSIPPVEDAEKQAVPESDEALRKRVIAGLDLLREEGIWKDGMVNWIGLDIDSVREVVSPTSLAPDLYSGRGGIALLFEKAYRVFGEDRWLQTARSALEIEMASYRRFGTETGVFSQVQDGCGPWGGLVASLWAVGRHEGMGECRDMALKMVGHLTESTIRKDERYDIIGGSAGAILLLVGMHEEEAIPGLEEVLGSMADQLVRTQIDDEGPGWPMFGGERAVCGFGHGRCGVGLALLEAGRILDRRDLLDLGLATFHGEHGLRGEGPDAGWPDLRGVRRGSSEVLGHGSEAWCNGLEGIALSRAAALHIVDDPVLRDDLEYSLVGANRTSWNPRYHLCCGRAGRVVTLGSLRRLLPEKELVDPMVAISSMAPGIDTIDHEVVFGLNGPGLFQGRAGAIWAGLSILDDDDSDLLLMKI